MTNTIAGTYSTLVTLGAAIDNPTTFTAGGLLNDGLEVSYSGLAVVNAGRIANGGEGIFLLADGSVTNQSGGTISGEEGIYARYASTVVNAGYIAGYGGTGVSLSRGGSVTNQSGGAISGYNGIEVDTGAATVVNAGRIGGTRGVYSWNASLTVVNVGTITGSHDAVQFAAGFANRLVIDPNAVFSGQVTGGNAIGAAQVSTLELASAGSVGTLSGLGTKYVDFAQVTVNAGAQWTLTSANTLAAGYTLTNAGTLSGPLTLAAGGVLSNASTGTITTSSGAVVYGATGGAATVVNAGVIAGNGGDDQGIYLADGGSVTNQSGGVISGYYGIEGRGATVTVVNAGSIAGSGQGVLLFAGGYVTNQSGGAISGVGVGIYAEDSAATVVNAGSIGYAGGISGVVLRAGGSVTNQSGGVISAYGGITGQGTLTVVNAGSIAGSKFDGVFLDAGGRVSNQNGGVISGVDGVYGQGGVTVANAGSIAGSTNGGAGVVLQDGGSVTNQSGGTISGYFGIDALNDPATVVNAGVIAGSYTTQGADGVYLHAGGSVTNLSGGTISAYNGIRITGASGTVVNLGVIQSNDIPSDGGGPGIYLADGGVVTNGTAGATVSSAYIGGYRYGVQFGSSASGTLTNFGTISGNPGSPAVMLTTGTIINGPSGATGALIEGGLQTNAVVINGVATVINYAQIVGVELSGDRGIYYGVKLGGSAGSISNLGANALIENYVGVYATMNDTVTNAGTIASNFAGGSAALVFGDGTNRLIIDPGAVFIGNVSGSGPVTLSPTGNTQVIGTAHGIGTTTLELASASSAGTLSGLGTTIVNFSSLVFDSGAQWTVAGNDAASGLGTLAITGFTYGDTIDLTGFVANSETFANNTLVLTDGDGAHETLAIQGAFQTGGFGLSADGSGTGTVITVICFAAGTQIGTPTGEVPVEKLQNGDLVLTAHHGPRPVKWIGNGKVLATRGRRSAATPVIVRKGALADNVPNRDLHVTKAHSLYIDDVLIPVEFLVNHRTILWDDRAQEVEIYHVELDSHDVLIANGAPAESYRDDGNRWLFQNANAGWHLPPQDPYAPVLTGGSVVDAAWRRLLDRAGPRHLPLLTEDPDLHLVIDGARVDPQYRRGSLYGFRLPSNPKSVVIASRVGVPSELGIARDPRSLGGAVRQVAVRQGAKFMLLDADDDRLTVGFHAYEADCNLRWTDGYAELPIAAFARFDKGAEVMLHLGGATQYPDEQASPARAAA